MGSHRRFTGHDLGRLLHLSNFLNSIAAAAARQADLEMMNVEAWAKSGCPVNSDAPWTSADEISTLIKFPAVKPRSLINS
jgi:hypothetical protein